MLKSFGIALSVFPIMVSTEAFALRCGGKMSGDRLSVTAADASCKWAFKHKEVALLCFETKGGNGVFIDAEGVRYPLNGTAKDIAAANNLSVTDFKAIEVRRNPEPGLLPGELSLTGPWIQAGLEVCRLGGTKQW
jgi:hypothetical protein